MRRTRRQRKRRGWKGGTPGVGDPAALTPEGAAGTSEPAISSEPAAGAPGNGEPPKKKFAPCGGVDDPQLPFFIPKFLEDMIESAKEATLPFPPSVVLSTIGKGLSDAVQTAMPHVIETIKKTVGDKEFILRMAPLIKSFIMSQIEAMVASRRWSTYGTAQEFETSVRLQQGLVNVSDLLSDRLDDIARSSTDRREWLDSVERLVQQVVLPEPKTGGERARRSRRRSRRRVRRR
jgi:hypothetical protein